MVWFVLVISEGDECETDIRTDIWTCTSRTCSAVPRSLIGFSVQWSKNWQDKTEQGSLGDDRTMKNGVSAHTTPFKESSLTSIFNAELGGILLAAGFPISFFSSSPSFPKANFAGRVMSLLSPTHMPLTDASHPLGSAEPLL